MDVNNLDIFEVRDKFGGQWIDILFKDGRKDSCFFFDIDLEADNDLGSDALVYNHTGSYNYGNVYALNDIKTISMNQKH